MTDARLLARAYHTIMTGFVRDGRAPHYSELALSLGMTPHDALQVQRDLTASGLPIWTHPDTDHLAAASPFSNIPTPYRVSVDGQQKWYAFGGLDVLAVRWLFPGKDVEVAARCLDCAAPLELHMRDDTIRAFPETMVGHANLPAPRWNHNWAHTGNNMNLFRSEEHVRRWWAYDATAAEGILPIDQWARVFGGDYYRRRLEPDFFLCGRELRQELFQILKAVGKSGPFWGVAAG